jgi:hypothetical protein
MENMIRELEKEILEVNEKQSQICHEILEWKELQFEV